MISGLFGIGGGYKSYSMVSRFIPMSLARGAFVVTNVPMYWDRWFSVADSRYDTGGWRERLRLVSPDLTAEQFERVLPSGTVSCPVHAYMDEMADVFDSWAPREEVAKAIKMLRYSRHMRIDLTLACQGPNLMQDRVVSQVGRWFRVADGGVWEAAGLPPGVARVARKVCSKSYHLWEMTGGRKQQVIRHCMVPKDPVWYGTYESYSIPSGFVGREVVTLRQAVGAVVESVRSGIGWGWL